MLSDTDGTVADAYGVRRPASSRWAAMPERRTFLIDPTGVVRRVYDVTDVFHHADEVLRDLHLLQAGA